MANSLRVLVLTTTLAVLSAALSLESIEIESLAVSGNAPRVRSSECGTVISSGLDESQKKEIVDTHNKYRSLVASGKEKRGKPGPQPPSKNIGPLQWSDKLAKAAQKLADTCVHDHDSAGQNLAWGDLSPQDSSVAGHVTMWYNEVENFNSNQVKAFVWEGQPPWFAHYTQVVWGKTTHVGCGYIKHKTNGEKDYLVCNYSPAGNYIGQPVY